MSVAPTPIESSTRKSFDRLVAGRLRSVGIILRLVTLGTGLMVIFSVVLVVCLVQLGLDFSLHLDVQMRLAILVMACITLLWSAYRFLLRPLSEPTGEDEVAVLVEGEFPQLHDSLISAVQLVRDPRPELHSSAMVERLARGTCEHTRQLSFRSVVDVRPLRNRSIPAVFLLVAFAVVAFAAPSGTMETWFRRNVLLADVDWPKMTHLIVENLADGRIIHARGDDLRISARLREGSARPRRVILETRTETGRERRVTMTAVGPDRFRFDLSRLTEAMTFRLLGGDDRTDWIPVELVDRPRLEHVELTVIPPAYARRPRVRLRSGQTTAQVLLGSKVEIVFQPNVPIARAVLVREEGPVARAEPTGDGRFRCRFSPAENMTCSFRLWDVRGLGNVRPARFVFHVINDEPPDVRLSVRGVSDLVTPQAVLPIRIQARDQYGLASASLLYDLSADHEQPESIRLSGFERGTKELDTDLELPIGTLGVGAGGRVSLQAAATDLDDVSGPNEGRSFLTTLRVVTREELLAELGRREQEHRMEFERLLRTQENLRGEVLDALSGRPVDPSASERDRHRRLVEAAARQRQITSRVKGVRAQFDQILQELRVNRMADAAVRRRLDDAIIAPLTTLGATQMDVLEELLTAVQPDSESIDRQMVVVIQHMRRVLGHMLQWEGFQEVLTLMQDLIEEQDRLNLQTEAEIERRIQELFGND